MPKRRTARVGVEGVYGIVFGCHKHDVVFPTGKRQIRHIKRLGEYSSVYGIAEEDSKMCRVDVPRLQKRFGILLPCPQIVVLPGCVVE